jgi:hypothetical protein
LTAVGGRGDGSGQHSNILMILSNEMICEIIHMLQMA